MNSAINVESVSLFQVARFHYTAIVVLSFTFIYSCGSSRYSINGGLVGTSFIIDKEDYVTKIEPLVAGSKLAADKLSAIRTRMTISAVMTYPSGILVFGLPPLHMLGYIDNSFWGYWLTSGIVFLVGTFIYPGEKSFAEVIELYNINNPTKPLCSDQMGIKCYRQSGTFKAANHFLYNGQWSAISTSSRCNRLLFSFGLEKHQDEIELESPATLFVPSLIDKKAAYIEAGTPAGLVGRIPMTCL